MVSEDNGLNPDFGSLKGIVGISEAISIQKLKLERLRGLVKDLTFKSIDMAGSYASITYKAIDGGRMKVNYSPFEINVVDVADSNGNKKLSFVIPEIGGDNLETKQVTDQIIKHLEEIPVIKKFVSLLGCKSLSEVSFILNDSGTLMEISEFACIFDRVTADLDEPIVILKDGLLRTKSIKSVDQANYIKKLRETLKEHKKYVKLVGVSKTSKVLTLLSTALFLEKKIPSNAIGYVKIPLQIELQAYEWTGKGKADASNPKPLNYAFGELYIAKLAKNSNLLVTIEVPKDLENNQPIYSEEEILEILSYLAKDSKFSYPVLGYPQTIMRAHEAAVRLGFPASIIRDEIRDKILQEVDEGAREFIRDGWLLIDYVDKGVLGGGNY